jgi:hypothetical protein
MGVRIPETCWAVFKRQVINLRSCCIWLVDSVESMMMHRLASPKSIQSLIYQNKVYTFIQHIYNLYKVSTRLHVSAQLGHHQASHMNRFVWLQYILGSQTAYKDVIIVLSATWYIKVKTAAKTDAKNRSITKFSSLPRLLHRLAHIF